MFGVAAMMLPIAIASCGSAETTLSASAGSSQQQAANSSPVGDSEDSIAPTQTAAVVAEPMTVDSTVPSQPEETFVRAESTDEVPADNPELPAIGSQPVGDRPTWIEADGTVDLDRAPHFISVARDGLVVGYVLTSDLYPADRIPGNRKVNLPLVDAKGQSIGYIPPVGPAVLNGE